MQLFHKSGPTLSNEWGEWAPLGSSVLNADGDPEAPQPPVVVANPANATLDVIAAMTDPNTRSTVLSVMSTQAGTDNNSFTDWDWNTVGCPQPPVQGLSAVSLQDGLFAACANPQNHEVETVAGALLTTALLLIPEYAFAMYYWSPNSGWKSLGTPA